MFLTKTQGYTAESLKIHIRIRILKGYKLGSKVVPVRIDDDMLKFIEELVKLGVYSSRSEALRDLIRIGARHVKQVKVIAEAVNKLFELEREEGDIPIRLEGALRQLLAERERF
jgi:Arc/MetJ-type ribon-helix-helix transcriptional regulator